MSASKTTVHTRVEIERVLRARLTPRTDNRNALLELGFTPAYPHLAHDAYYGGLWTRAIEARGGSLAGRGSHTRALVMERAFYTCVRRRSGRIRLRRVAACAALRTRRRAYSPLRAGRLTSVARVTAAGKGLAANGA